MSTSKSLGSLLQGVSQQPAHIRPEGKVTEQINMTSDVVRGLTARPALRHVADLSGALADSKFFMARVSGQDHLFGHTAGNLKSWALETGAVIPLAYQDAAAQAYIGPDLANTVYDGQIYVTNRDTEVAAAASPDTSGTLTGQGLVVCLGAQFSRTYRVQLRYADGVAAYGTYVTPEGIAEGDAALSSGEAVMTAIEASLLAHANLRVGTTVSRSGATILIAHTAAFTINATDSDSDVTMRSHVDRAESIADLAATAPHGTLVRITGDDEGTSDDYWLRFKSDVTTTVGNGFGNPGVWEEWYNTAEVSAFDLTTMPHVLTYAGGSFTLSRGGWLGRRTGDADTNPFLEIVGNPVRDINTVQSRMVFAVKDGGACMSRAEHPLDFFKKSALTELADDPIGVRPTGDNAPRVDWIVPFDKDLVFLTDPGKGQFVISGASGLTPSTAALVQTTAFEMQGGARPVETGRTILFPFRSGKYSGINEFYTTDAIAANGVDNTTDTVNRYILGPVDRLECNTNSNLLFVKSSDPSVANTVWVYKYMWRGTDKVQSSWGKYEFPNEVAAFFFVSSNVYFVLRDGANYTLNVMDLDLPDDEVVGYHVCLDRRQSVVLSGTVDLPYPNASFVQSTGCTSIGSEVASTVTGPVGGVYTYTLDVDVVEDGMTVIAGIKYSRLVAPTMPFLRDRNGVVLAGAHVVVGSFYVDYDRIGALDATMTSPYRDPYTFRVNYFEQGDDPSITAQGLRTGTLEVPWGERSDWSTLTLSSDDARPTTILDLKWDGQPFKP